MRLLFLPHWNKKLRLPSLCKQSVLTFAQLLAVLLANLHVQDSLTTKISETRIWACFTKITNHMVK